MFRRAFVHFMQQFLTKFRSPPRFVPTSSPPGLMYPVIHVKPQSAYTFHKLIKAEITEDDRNTPHMQEGRIFSKWLTIQISISDKKSFWVIYFFHPKLLYKNMVQFFFWNFCLIVHKLSKYTFLVLFHCMWFIAPIIFLRLVNLCVQGLAQNHSRVFPKLYPYPQQEASRINCFCVCSITRENVCFGSLPGTYWTLSKCWLKEWNKLMRLYYLDVNDTVIHVCVCFSKITYIIAHSCIYGSVFATGALIFASEWNESWLLTLSPYFCTCLTFFFSNP